jgi:flavin reductase (DIM6/NTAB) family NADH-FMN oxidoreductase RutF
MFYETSKNDHGLPRDPFKAIVSPRPIGWISSMSASGQVNLAPYSFFNGVSAEPPIVMFSSEGYKDSIAFIMETREFVCNVPSYELREAVVKTSAELARGINEMELAELAPAPCRLVKAPRVAAAPVAMECKLLKVVTLEDLDGSPVDRHVVFGQVVGIHIDERFLKNGRLDTAAMKPIARCGYADYAVVDKVFSIARPNVSREPELQPSVQV